MENKEQQTKNFFADNLSTGVYSIIIAACILILFIPFGLAVSEKIARYIFIACLFGIVKSIAEIIRARNLKFRPVISFSNGNFEYFKGFGKSVIVPISKIKNITRNGDAFLLHQNNGREVNMKSLYMSDVKLTEVEKWVNENIKRAAI